MDSRAAECPYCHSENPEGIRFQQEVTEKMERIRLLKPFIMKKKTPDIVYKYMTGLLAALIGVNLLIFMITVGVAWIGEQILKPAEPAAGSYAEKFDEYCLASFYGKYNKIFEKRGKGQLPSSYEVESVIGDGFRILCQAGEEGTGITDGDAEKVMLVLEDYLKLTEEEMSYIEKQVREDGYLEYDWKESVADETLRRMEAETE